MAYTWLSGCLMCIYPLEYFTCSFNAATIPLTVGNRLEFSSARTFLHLEDLWYVHYVPGLADSYLQLSILIVS